jgi:hypothetical protein
VNLQITEWMQKRWVWVLRGWFGVCRGLSLLTVRILNQEARFSHLNHYTNTGKFSSCSENYLRKKFHEDHDIMYGYCNYIYFNQQPHREVFLDAPTLFPQVLKSSAVRPRTCISESKPILHCLYSQSDLTLHTNLPK